MAVMQYIGARYVPLLYGEWIPNKENGWEPLTIVTYQGDSYTSKKIVPPSIGNPAENTEYWALTGAFNAQIEALRQQVLHIADVGEVQEDVTNLNKSELQFNINETYNSLDIICTALENVCSIKQRGNTLVIDNNNENIEIYVQGITLYITEV